MQHYKIASTLLAGLLLLACGGGGGGVGALISPTSVVISGSAGSGASIVGGTVEAKCATGSGTATTEADGSYSLSISGGVGPCVLRVTSADNKFVFHSSVDTFASNAAKANITPLTEMVVANALGTTPSNAFSSGVSTTVSSKLTSSNLDNAVVAVQQALPALGVSLGSINPLKDTLLTDSGSGGNAQDRAIDGLMIGLASSNKTVGDLATLMSSAATATAASQAFTSFASTHQIASSTLAGCPFARSGKFLMAGPADRYFTMINVNFSTNSGTFKRLDPTVAEASRTSQSITITPDLTNPCLFKFTPSGGSAASVMMTSSGVGVFSKTTSPSTFPTNAFTGPMTGAAGTGGTANFLGLALPVQTVVLGQFDGRYSGISFYKTAQDSFYKVGFGKTEASGTSLIGYNCSPSTGSCTPDNNETVSANDDDYTNYNIYTSRSAPNSAYFTKSAIYRTAQGDKIVVSLTYGPNVDSALSVATNRQTDMPAPVANTSTNNYSWLVLNGTGSNAGTLFQKSYAQTFAINGVVGNAVTRTDTATNDQHILTINSPAKGMYKMTAGSNGGSPALIGITIAGLTVFASANTTSANASDHVFGFGARY